jgi:hypothetical protein
MEQLLKEGFYYKVELKARKKNIIKDMRIYYYGIEIYHHILHMSVSADIIFMTICAEYKNNFIK